MHSLNSANPFKGRVGFFSVVLFLKILFLRSYVFPLTMNYHILLLELASPAILFTLMGLFKPRTTLFWLADFLLSTYFMSCVIYHNHFGNLLNLNALLQAAVVKDLGPSILELFSVRYLLFYFDFIFFFISIKIQKKIPKSFHWKRPLRHLPPHGLILTGNLYQTILPAFALVLALTFTLFHVLSYPAKDNRMAMARDVGVLNAQGYELLNSLPIRKKTPLPSNQLNQETINQIKQIQPVRWPKYFGAASGKNLILVQLESTENFVVGLKINNQEITPTLNSLLRESFYFPHFFSQVGQGTTSDAEFITNTSLYPREKGAVFRGISYPSLPRLLKREGYTSVTFHPNDLTFWNRDSLYPCLGFDKYYAKDFYQDEDKLGRWGSSDEVLYTKALPVLADFQEKKQKFYASFITLTNHHPFILPESRKHLKLSSQLEGTSLGNYLTSVNYQDYALGLFIKNLQAHNLWESSIFVIFGDHFGIPQIMESENQELFTLLLGRKHDSLDGLNVPLLIRVPGLKPQVFDTAGGQVDLLPTLANLLGLPLNNQLTFGQDILNTEQNLLGFRFRHPDGTFLSSNTFHLAGSKTGQDLASHKTIQNEEFFLNEEKRIKYLMDLSDSYIQSLLKKGTK